jgi:outer membrane lipoprotein LolB
LHLLGSLGTPSARIEGSHGAFILKTSDGKTWQASEPDALAKHIFGYSLPVAGLRYWVMGIPAPGKHRAAFSSEHLLSSLQQDGWQINYLNYQTVGLYTLPTELTLKRGELSVRILIKDWTL